MTTPPRFPAHHLAMIDKAKILGVRAGGEHRFTGVWVVVLGGRVFVRTWNDKPTGWYRAFRREPQGAISIGADEVSIRARPVRGARILRDVTAAYAAKYHTKASEKWVRGFAEPQREAATLELLPE